VVVAVASSAHLAAGAVRELAVELTEAAAKYVDAHDPLTDPRTAG
jgi:hypothetical protein